MEWDWLREVSGPLDADFVAAALEECAEQPRPELDYFECGNRPNLPAPARGARAREKSGL